MEHGVVIAWIGFGLIIFGLAFAAIIHDDAYKAQKPPKRRPF